jgi:hypothetical protein
MTKTCLFQVECLEFRTFEIGIYFEFRASIFEFALPLDTQTPGKPLCLPQKNMGHSEFAKKGVLEVAVQSRDKIVDSEIGKENSTESNH